MRTFYPDEEQCVRGKRLRRLPNALCGTLAIAIADPQPTDYPADKSRSRESLVENGAEVNARGRYSTGIWVGGFGRLNETLIFFKTQRM